MATMRPESFPHDLKVEPKRKAESKVYDKLKQILDDSFHVFYGCWWLGGDVGHTKRDGKRAEYDGESDFVIAHPQRGILFLEVKGGGVKFDANKAEWTSEDRYGEVNPLRDPVGQARDSKHQLRRKLCKKLKELGRLPQQRIPAWHGVVLPDASLPEGVGDLGADKPRDIFWCKEDFERDQDGEWIGNRMGVQKSNNQEEILGDDGMRVLEDVLAKSFCCPMVLQEFLCGADSKLEALTEAQFRVLKGFQLDSRVIIRGGAGTGKTILALEEAARQVEGGRRVLFVCFNQALAAWVKRGLEGATETFDVRTFYSLCWKMGQDIGIELPSDDSSRADWKLWYEERAPNALMTGFNSDPNKQYDAIIVDEGQDFKKHMWDALDVGLKPEAVLRVFSDKNQLVHQQKEDLPKNVKDDGLNLSYNLRNTEKIQSAFNRFYNGPKIESSKIKGPEVKWLSVPAKGLAEIGRELSEYAGRLIAKEDVPPGDIAVLVPNKNDIKVITPDNHFGGCETTRCEKPRDGAIVVDSIRRFKGLERRVVLLAADHSLVDKSELSYVAMSRARVHLVVAGEDSILDQLGRPPQGKQL